MDRSILTVFNLSSTDTETQSQERENFKTGYALVIISVAIVIGNSLVLFTVKSFAKRLVADIFISSLALLDIIHTITSILLAILFKWTLIEQSERFGALCKTQAWITVTTQIHSAFIVTVINLERLTAVSRPFFYKSYVNTRRAVKTLVMLLLFSISISSLPLIAWGKYVLLPKMSLCLFYHDSDFAIIIVIIGYTDFLVVSYCFVAIKISLKKFMERQARFVARRGAIVDLQAGGIAQKMTKSASKSFIQSQRLLKVTAMVSGLFYFSWLPLMISITRALITHEPNYVLNLMASLQPLSSPLVNPLIYFFTWERYKKSYVVIFKRLIACLPKYHDRTIFNKGLSSTISHATTIQMNVVEDKNPGKSQTPLADICTNSFLSGELNDRSMDSRELPKATSSLDEKLRSSSKTSQCHSSSLEEVCQTKHHISFSEFTQSISAENEVCLGENVKAGTEGLKSLNIDNLNNTPYRMKLSTEFHKTIAQYSKVIHGEHKIEHSKVSMKDNSQYENYVRDSSSPGNRINQCNNSENSADKCLITQRLGEYLTNVINDQCPQNTKKICKIPGKQAKYIKRKRDGSEKNSQKFYEYSTSEYQNTRNRSRRRRRQSYFRRRDKFSRNNYLKDFEEFRKKLDEDARKRNISKENHEAEIHFHETSQRCSEKDETSEPPFPKSSPKTHEYNRHVDRSEEIHDGGLPNHSKKGNQFQETLETK